MNIEKFEKQNKEKQDSIISAGIEEFSGKSYTDASTDVIVQNCGISKGLLFHYFGTKKEFYLYCLTCSLERLIEDSEIPQGDFYSILFAVMDRKLSLCMQNPKETRFVNMASRDMSSEIAKGKSEIFLKYAAITHAASAAVMEHALATLPLITNNQEKVKDGIQLYVNAILSKYLLIYQNTPDDFFKNSKRIKAEMKEYIDFMLYGIVKEDGYNERN